MVSIIEEQAATETTSVDKMEISYEAKCALTIPIAKPLATRKLSKKLYKCCKIASKVSWRMVRLFEIWRNLKNVLIYYHKRANKCMVPAINQWSLDPINGVIGWKLLKGQQPKRYINFFDFRESHYQYWIKVIRWLSPNMLGTT